MGWVATSLVLQCSLLTCVLLPLPARGALGWSAVRPHAVVPPAYTTRGPPPAPCSGPLVGPPSLVVSCGRRNKSPHTWLKTTRTSSLTDLEATDPGSGVGRATLPPEILVEGVSFLCLLPAPGVSTCPIKTPGHWVQGHPQPRKTLFAKGLTFTSSTGKDVDVPFLGGGTIQHTTPPHPKSVSALGPLPTPWDVRPSPLDRDGPGTSLHFLASLPDSPRNREGVWPPRLFCFPDHGCLVIKGAWNEGVVLRMCLRTITWPSKLGETRRDLRGE